MGTHRDKQKQLQARPIAFRGTLLMQYPLLNLSFACTNKPHPASPLIYLSICSRRWTSVVQEGCIHVVCILT